jgi:hypothetical protein
MYPNTNMYPNPSTNIYPVPNTNMYPNLNTNMYPYENTNSMNKFANNYTPSVIDIPPPNYDHIVQNGFPAYVQLNSQYDMPMPALPASNKF